MDFSLGNPIEQSRRAFTEIFSLVPTCDDIATGMPVLGFSHPKKLSIPLFFEIEGRAVPFFGLQVGLFCNSTRAEVSTFYTWMSSAASFEWGGLVLEAAVSSVRCADRTEHDVARKK